jgi:DNA-binding response OmpR family regulator
MKKGLELHGFQVTAYNDPQKVIDDYRPNQYDHHVLDIRLPGMSGFDLARRIWQKDPKAQVCFLSSFEIHEDEARLVFKDLNNMCFMTKPMTPSGLARHLRGHNSH